MTFFSRLAFLLLFVLSPAYSLLGIENSLPPAPEGTFSIVVIPDTQQYHGRGTKAQPKSDAPVTNESLEADMHWILDHLESQHIVFVSHVGDIVDKNVPEQWEVARHCMDRLQGRASYGIAVGNHDMKSNGDCSLFQKYFPADRFAGFDWYGGTFPNLKKSDAPPADSQDARYGNNANSFQLFSVQGLDFLALHLECNAPDSVLQWADEVLKTHAQRRAMVTTHMGLGPIDEPKTRDDFLHAPKGRMRWSKCFGQEGNSPEQMWEKCFRKHPNLFVIWSGDQSRTEAMRQTSMNDGGQPVYEVLSDYNDGWLRVCRFTPQENKIEVWTVDSRTGSLCQGTKYVPEVSEHNFRLHYVMNGHPAESK